MFAVISAEAVPDHLRGYLSRYLQEVHTGLYVGVLSRRVCDELWQRTITANTTGWAVLIRQDASLENGYDLDIHGKPNMTVLDIDGIRMPATTAKPRNLQQ